MRVLYLGFALILAMASPAVYAKANEAVDDVTPSASHLIFEYEADIWQIDLAQFGFDGIDPTTVDRPALRAELDRIFHKIERPPQNAFFRNREPVPHVTGRHVDRTQVDEWLDGLVWKQNKVQPLTVLERNPEITTDVLTRLSEKELGRYTTKFNPDNTPRVQNIELSGLAIDYVVVPRNSVFSFNTVVGQRTADRGYQPAPIIVKGEYAEGIGGGICQTSSTLFNSVDQAGLKIVERVAHSKRVTYVPQGRDAAVSWGGPDFKFKNNLNRPVLIASVVQPGSITVTIHSQVDVKYAPNDVPAPPNKAPEQIQNPGSPSTDLDSSSGYPSNRPQPPIHRMH